MSSNNSIGRRKFIQLSGITGTGFLLGLQQTGLGRSAVTKFAPDAGSFHLTPYVQIEPGGRITIFNTKDRKSVV
jgi:hypothetical protein